jgi:molecular chaperone DnaJ
VKDGQKIRLAGRGAAGDRGGPAGDLLVNVHVTPHRLFGRKGDHITITVPVTFPEAALGANISVPTLDAPVTLKIPAGTASGRTFRVRGRGVQKKAGVAGDLLVTVEVAVPARLDDEARELLMKYAAAADHDPREHLREVNP